MSREDAQSDNPSRTGLDETEQILRARHAPIVEARRSWGAWSEVSMALTIYSTDDPRAVVDSVARLQRALVAVGEGEVFERLDRHSKLLPATWEVIRAVRERQSPEVIARELARWEGTPFAGDIWDELTGSLWSRVRDSLQVDANVSRAARATADAVERLEVATIVPPRSTTGPTIHTEAPSASAASEDPSEVESAVEVLRRRVDLGLDGPSRIAGAGAERAGMADDAQGGPRSVANEPRSRRRPAAPKGWIYTAELCAKYGVSDSNMHRWTAGWGRDRRVKDDDSKQVRFKESSVRELLSGRGLLPK